MPIATIISEFTGAQRRFAVDLCPVHLLYCGTLYARQGGEWNANSTYRRTHCHVIDDAQRIDETAPAPDDP